MAGLKEKMKANPKQKRKNKMASGARGAAPLEMNGEAATEGQKAAAAEQEPSGEEEEDEVSSTNSSVPPGNRVENNSCCTL